MGHLTRVRAIARRLPREIKPILLTWSQALRLAAKKLIMRAAMLGLNIASPLLTARMARSISSCLAPLST